MPNRPALSALQWQVWDHRGRRRVDVGLSDVAENASSPRQRFAEPTALLGQWARGQAQLDPLLLAVVRALVGNLDVTRAASEETARVEPAPGVLVLPLRTPTLPPATHTNCVLVGDRDLVLIEPASPYAEEQAALEREIARLAAQGRRIVALLLTHHHPDHTGGAGRLRAKLGVPLCAHAETARRLGGVVVDRLLDDGEEAFGLRALHTPGHAPGHLCFLAPQARLLVAGDMVAGQGTILVSPRDEGDMATYLASLERLTKLDLAALVPAHGPPTARPRALLEHYVAHRRMRESRVLEALGAASGSVAMDALLPQVYDDTPRTAWPLALLSLEAHLEKLEKEGRAARAQDGLWRAWP